MSQVEAEGRHFQLLKKICNHRSDRHVIPKRFRFSVSKNNMLVEAIGVSDSQHVIPTQVSLGEYPSIKQGRKYASLFPAYYSDETSVRGSSNNG